MPACFQLFPKGSTEPASFADIDDAMRAHFGAPPDEKHFYCMWYDVEGFELALGYDWDKMRQTHPNRKDIIDWLEANYTSKAWYSH